MGKDIDSALNGHPGSGTVRRMREDGFAPAVSDFDSCTHNLDRHDHDRTRRRPRAGHEFHYVGPACELGFDKNGILHPCYLRRLRRKDVVGTTPCRHERGARGENRWAWNLAALDAVPERQRIGKVGASIYDMHEAEGGKHRAKRNGKRPRGRGVRRTERIAHKVDVAVPEPGRYRLAPAIDGPGILRYMNGSTGADGGDGGIFNKNDAILDHRILR